MYFFTLDIGVFRFVKESDGSKCSVSFYNKDIFHIRLISNFDTLLCETVIHLIFNLINDNDTVRRYAAFKFQKEAVFDFLIRQPADAVRLRKETVLRGQPL